MEHDESEAEWPVEALSAGWLALAARVADLPAERWDHLVCLVAQGGHVMLYPERCESAPLPRQEHPDEKVSAHFALELVASCVVHPELPPLDEGWAGRWLREEWDADEELVPEPEPADVERLLADLVAESVSAPEVEAAFAGLGGPERFGVFWCGDHEGAWCVHHRQVWGRPLPPLAPAQTALGALSPLFWHPHSYVGRHHSGLGFAGDTLVEAVLAGPGVTDATLAWLTPEAAAACGSLHTLTLAETAVSDDAVARLRALLPSTEVEVRTTPLTRWETPYEVVRGGRWGAFLRTLRGIFGLRR